MPSVELRLHRYCPAGCGSNCRPRRPDPAFAYPLACPVSRDTSNPTMPAQPSPRACTHVVSARKWTYCRWAAHHPDQPAGAQGCGRHSLKLCAAPATERPSLQIAATAVRCLPKLETARAHVPPSAHGVRIPARCARAGPDGGPRAVACCLGAVRSTFRPGGQQPGARSTHRPQAVVIPRLRHLGWPRMRGLAPVRSHYARIAGEPAGHADQTGLPDPVWRSRRWPMGRRAAAVPGSWEHFKLALICTFTFIYKGLLPASAEGPGSQIRAAIATHRSVAAARAHLRGPCFTWGGCHGCRECPVPATSLAASAAAAGPGGIMIARVPTPLRCDRPWYILTRASGPPWPARVWRIYTRATSACLGCAVWLF